MTIRRVYKHFIVSKAKMLKLLHGKRCWRRKAEQPNYTKMVKEVSTISPRCSPALADVGGHRKNGVTVVGDTTRDPPSQAAQAKLGILRGPSEPSAHGQGLWGHLGTLVS